MTDKVLCPWCGSEMQLNQQLFLSFYVCRKCGAHGPVSIEGTELAYAATLRRYEPPVKPLTLEEVKPGVLKIDEWVEFSNGYVRHIIPDVIDGEYLWDKNDCYYDLRTYGTDWRLWPRRPTEEEREAAGWEDEHENTP